MTARSGIERMRQELAALDREVERGLVRLRKQWTIVERLEDQGLDSTQARKSLRALEQIQADNVRRRLEMSIAVLVHPGDEKSRREQMRAETVSLLNALAKLERDISRGEEILQQQRALIFDLELRGLPSHPARSLLQTFEQTQALRLAERQKVQSRLSQKPVTADSTASESRQPQGSDSARR